MKFLIRWAFRFAVFIVVLIVAAVLLKDLILAVMAERNIENSTGLDAQIGEFQMGFLSPTITFKDLVLQNKKEFGGDALLNVPDLHIEYDRIGMAQGKLHLPVLRLHLAKLHIVEGKDGRNNFTELVAKLQETLKTKGLQDLDFDRIDTLRLTVREVQYTSLKDPAKSWRQDLGIQDEVVTDVQEWSDLQGLLLKVLARQGLQQWFLK